MPESRMAQFNGILLENDDIYRRAARALKLSDCVFWILYALRERKDPPTQSQICALFFEPKQTVNSALKKMALEDLIQLTPTGSGRGKHVVLTQKGLSLAKVTVDPIMRSEREALDELPAAEQEALLSAFRKYTCAMKEKMRSLNMDKER